MQKCASLPLRCVHLPPPGQTYCGSQRLHQVARVALGRSAPPLSSAGAPRLGSPAHAEGGQAMEGDRGIRADQALPVPSRRFCRSWRENQGPRQQSRASSQGAAHAVDGLVRVSGTTFVGTLPWEWRPGAPSPSCRTLTPRICSAGRPYGTSDRRGPSTRAGTTKRWGDVMWQKLQRLINLGILHLLAARLRRSPHPVSAGAVYQGSSVAAELVHDLVGDAWPPLLGIHPAKVRLANPRGT